jgi:glycosyltransferase involved in cell wall biosynthesis
MACGAPVIASDRGSIPEVAGGAALLADAEDATLFAAHLARVLGEPAEAARLRQLGQRRAAEFSWRRTATGVLDGYLRVAGCDAAARPRASGRRAEVGN